jgi:hypothetical protein
VNPAPCRVYLRFAVSYRAHGRSAASQDGGLPSTGIPYVLVNGTVVIRDSETVDDVFPGKPIHGSAKAG